ncbi:hypothetical protein [Naasia aerilata]|uniref:Protein-tyrosine-phosphatase n=1 Tax=Naasia aerilata TaxID=1162966 RepID=A0ABM8GCF0_9MICO|nr:hypothetical protein [Naasia aerilata]BDZ45927.1 protein-tyrosine-phosphatase [Naasia aerilata]
MPRILVVCTANVCRSAYAGMLLAHRLAVRVGEPWVVTSAGTLAVAGQSVCPVVLERMEREQLKDEALVHESRRLDHDMVRRADLILTADTSHRSSVARLDAQATRRTFTMLEAVKLGALLPAPVGAGRSAGPLSDLVGELHSARPRLVLPPSHRRHRSPLDIEDGHNISGIAHSSALRQVHDTVDRLVELLAVAS